MTVLCLVSESRQVIFTVALQFGVILRTSFGGVHLQLVFCFWQKNITDAPASDEDTQNHLT